jgi:hypothetical protein
MTEQRRTNPNQRHADEPRAAKNRDGVASQDAGAYIGRKPERATETIPGGLGRKDQRVAAVATQPAPVREKGGASDAGAPPAGHREAETATDDRVREAGQSR